MIVFNENNGGTLNPKYSTVCSEMMQMMQNVAKVTQNITKRHSWNLECEQKLVIINYEGSGRCSPVMDIEKYRNIPAAGTFREKIPPSVPAASKRKSKLLRATSCYFNPHPIISHNAMI